MAVSLSNFVITKLDLKNECIKEKYWICLLPISSNDFNLGYIKHSSSLIKT